MRRFLLVSSTSASMGCATLWSLPEVPITGGTSAERQLVRRELIAFDEAVGAGRVQIASFEIGEVDGEAFGRVRSGRRVTVEPGIEPEDLVRVVRHELCHALDFQEHLTDDAPPPLAAFLPALWPTLADWGGTGTPIQETLAHFCQSGPFGAQALSEPCPGDDPRGTALTAWLMDHVWTAFDATYATGPSVGRDLGPDVATYQVRPYQDPVHVVRVSFGDGPTTLSMALADGSTAEPGRGEVDTATGFGTLTPGFPVVPAPLGYLAEPRVNGVGLEGGPFVAPYFVVFDSFMLNSHDTIERSAPRIMGWDGEAWWMATDGCLQPGQGVFVTDDGVFWSTWIEGTELRWAPFVPN